MSLGGRGHRRRIVVQSYEQAVTTCAEVVQAAGALSLEIGWTHPEYPDADPTSPPAGVPVTWYASATFPSSYRHHDERSRYAVRHEEAPSAEHGRAVAFACMGLVRKLGARVKVVES